MKKLALVEHIDSELASFTLLEGKEDNKKVRLVGIAIQGDMRNRNGRIYPKQEIETAVNEMKDRIEKYGPIPGECDHPSGVTISLDRVSHLIRRVWMEGSNGHAEFEIMDFGVGEIVGKLIKAGLKIGVSSRGQGNVNDDGRVSEFEIATIDVVATPSAPDAYPRAIIESLQESSSGRDLLNLSQMVKRDKQAQLSFLHAFKHALNELK